MSAHRNFAPGVLAALARAALGRPLSTLFLCAVLAGCRHKIAPYTIPPAAQVPLAVPPPPTGEPAQPIKSEPAPNFGPLPAVNPRPPAPRRRSSPKEEPAPLPSPDEPAAIPSSLAIGTLSTGINSTPQIQQQAQDLISSIRKRVVALPARTADAQKRQIRQVRHFLDEAQHALNTGDTEGANNLATKGRLLMDDLEKN